MCMIRDHVELAIDASIVGHALIAICTVHWQTNDAHCKYYMLYKYDHILRSKMIANNVSYLLHGLNQQSLQSDSYI